MWTAVARGRSGAALTHAGPAVHLSLLLVSLLPAQDLTQEFLKLSVLYTALELSDKASLPGVANQPARKHSQTCTCVGFVCVRMPV